MTKESGAPPGNCGRQQCSACHSCHISRAEDLRVPYLVLKAWYPSRRSCWPGSDCLVLFSRLQQSRLQQVELYFLPHLTGRDDKRESQSLVRADLAAALLRRGGFVFPPTICSCFQEVCRNCALHRAGTSTRVWTAWSWFTGANRPRMPSWFKGVSDSVGLVGRDGSVWLSCRSHNPAI